MSVDCGYVIIWLDAHIGNTDNCRKMKKEFQSNLVQAAAVPPIPDDPINDLICTVSEYSAPISFARTVNDALELIQQSLLLKKVIFISSATLGKEILPHIVDQQLQLQSYYVFCADVKSNCEFGDECIANGLDVQIFDHEKTLLIRLGRDMSRILIEDGKILLNGNRPELALEYFKYAYALANKAFQHDTPLDPSDRHRPSTEYQQILNDLIDKANKAQQ